MSDLNKKLEAIRLYMEKDGTWITIGTYPGVAELIKQVLKDDGWVKRQEPDAYLLSNTTASTPEGKLTMKFIEEQFDEFKKEQALDWNRHHGYMSGQTFYERFDRELAASHMAVNGEAMLAVAKKAAGIDL